MLRSSFRRNVCSLLSTTKAYTPLIGHFNFVHQIKDIELNGPLSIKNDLPNFVSNALNAPCANESQYIEMHLISTRQRKQYHMKKKRRLRKRMYLRRLASVPYNATLEIIKAQKRTWRRCWETRLLVKKRGRDDCGRGRRSRLRKQR